MIELVKSFGDTDFVVDVVDIESFASITAHGYRGGPFVIEAADAVVALPIILAWQTGHVTTVHEATAGFSGTIARALIAAPTIALFADGNEDIAFGYLNAAGIPDSTGAAWADGSPDTLTVDDIRGPTDTVHDDGALFDEDGDPAFCELMSMHWGVGDREDPGGEEVVAEVRSFLNYRTHFFAQCQAVNAFENAINGRFLTRNGFEISGDPTPLVFINSWYTFAQMDGSFETVGGSERSYSLPPGDTYLDTNIVMITADTSPLAGSSDLWMTGYLDGRCEMGGDPETECTESVGKISYLGGHQYETRTPMSTNPATQGARLFLNSVFEADCVIMETPLDTDGDGIPDDEELEIGTDPYDADSDDDGVPDGDEPDYDEDTDGDGLINALDPDSDNDGILDGTEMGVTEPGDDTDTSVGNFVPDEDPSTTTDPLDADTDGGGTEDGDEDTNHDGAVDEGECDPNDPSDDAECWSDDGLLASSGSGCACNLLPRAAPPVATLLAVALLAIFLLLRRRR
ncbi:MAG: hypothetical protein JRG91_18885 [Deltaproteobacteria bacterium]|nr:hypothetical protein [Deltaproteobacteria bacterium]